MSPSSTSTASWMRIGPASRSAVTTCTVLQWNEGPYPYWNRFLFHGLAAGAPTTDGIRIAYVNQASKVADRVEFLVNYRGEIERIVDVGTFSPNVTINHTFGNFSGLAYLGSRPNVCRNIAVRFRDGSIWRAPRFQERIPG